MSEPVPVSGEDQPDPRLRAAAEAMAILGDEDGCFQRVADWQAMEPWEQESEGYPHDDEEPCRYWLAKAAAAISAIDACDCAAGIRRVTEQFTRQQMWGAWDDGYEAARTGQQPAQPVPLGGHGMTGYLHIPTDGFEAAASTWIAETFGFSRDVCKSAGLDLATFLRGMSVEHTEDSLAAIPRYVSDELRWIATSGRAKSMVVPHLCAIADALDARPLAAPVPVQEDRQ